MLYRYSVYTNDKRIVSGSVESVSEKAAEENLYKAGYVRILELKKVSRGLDWKKSIGGPGRLKTQNLLDFTLELGILTESGMPLLIALKQLEKQSTEKIFKEIVASLIKDLEDGMQLHQALGKFPQVFSEAYRCIIEANERSGSLTEGLRQIARQLKQQIAVKSHLQGALTQPLIILSVAVLVSIILAIVVLPQLVNIFSQFGEDLPWNAKLLINILNFVTFQKFNLLLGLFVVVVLVVAVLKNPKTKPVLDGWVFKLPLIGKIVSWNNTAYFSRMVSNLLSSGILLPDAINIVLRGISNLHFRASLSEARKYLIEGKPLSAALFKNHIFPPLLIELISVGEATGNLDSALGTVADYFESKVEKRIDKLLTLIEPALIIIISLVVGFLAVTMISSIYGLVGNFTG